MIRYITAALLLCTMLSSCVIEQNIHFKSDLSGRYNLHFDMSALQGLDDDTTGTGDMGIDPATFDELRNQMAAAPGITNVTSKMEGGVFDLNYEFESIQALQNANKGDNELGGLLKLTSKGKKITIDMTPSKEMDPNQNEELGQVGDMLTFRYNMTFDRPIKSVKGKLGQWDKESNIISYNFGMSEMGNKKTNWKTVVTFK